MIEKVHHIGIAVNSLEDALNFYRDTLGLHVHAQAEIADQDAASRRRMSAASWKR